VKWEITKEWEGQDAFILGGGPSLRGFDWSKFEGRNTIGCNSAYILGPRVAKLCLFSDNDWFEKNEDGLMAYSFAGGRCVTHCEYVPRDLHWVSCLERQMKFFLDDGTIYHGYGGNSGSAALHLALLMGARRVFLFGFDGALGQHGESNWHDRAIESPNAKVYIKFNTAWDVISTEYRKVFPGTEIYNCNPNSAITHFIKTEPDMALEGWCGGFTTSKKEAVA
jgi:hypothetical protein